MLTYLTDGWKQFQEDIQAATNTINIMSMKDALKTCT